MMWKIVVLLLIVLNAAVGIRNPDPSLSNLSIIIFLAASAGLFLKVVKFLKSGR